ncbi:unnamed protein product [Cuscuta campestris]|uniref:Protein kinase domain-containing protein n=1 Tax=Cuscuta campestris TaxID=132261 RepID=A0A484L0J3_9ASTE|nr:unnamed protein product [Cuscuta campestris]
MEQSSSSCRRRLLLAAVFLNFLLIPARSGRTDCAPSTCGEIRNISSPFRLNTDSDSCGDERYTLYCENNATVLYLYSGRYFVRAINYNNFTIRVADVGVLEGDCSSFPVFPLGYFNFSGGDPYGTYNWNRTSPYLLTASIVLVSCPTPLNSSFVGTSPCLNSKNYSNLKRYSYLLPGSVMTLGNLKKQCTIEKSVLLSSARNYTTYEDMHRGLVYGFELSWYRINCGRKCHSDCYLDDITGSPACEGDHGTLLHMCELRGFFRLRNGNDECRVVGATHALDIIINLWKTFKGSYLSLIYLIGLLQATKTTLGTPFVIALLIYKWKRRHLSAYDKVEEFLQKHNNLMPIRYSYSEIKKMTGSFKDTLGKGGFGAVYKGKLRSGKFAAIKMLLNSKGNGEDFISEVATIGRIHHVNVVQLIGFCVEGTKRALVYEFMPNGSLDKYVLSQEGSASTMTWEKLRQISLGVARGIEYLHQGCNMQILHFDIKPHNILLDENFTPKVSDFGLARLYSTDNNRIATLTAVRGTIGYMAPELFYKNIGRVSHKADVYSFGMLLLDMTGKRHKPNVQTEDSSQYFPQWVYNQVCDGRDAEIGGTTEEENRIAKKMVMVGLWCIEMNPNSRPSMNKVVDMLVGDTDSLQLPPRAVTEAIETPVSDGTETSFDYCSDSTSLIQSFNQEHFSS